MALKCLGIGVSDAPPLEYLPGAANGARAIGAWALAAGYETRVLTDESHPIGMDTIAAALVGPPAPGAPPPLLRRGERVTRLLIYFAGHGLARDGGEDLWLLSEWFQTQRAVAVSAFRRKLQRYGIDQVTVIADACRSLANDADSADLVPDAVLGRGPFDPGMPMSDMLRASSKYRAAYMIPGDAPEDDRCIFTGVLEEALWGLHDDAFRDRPQGRCITSGSLARFLMTAVPARAQTYRVQLDPDVQPGFIEPDDLYRIGPAPAAPTLGTWPEPSAVGTMGPGTPRPDTGMRGWSTQPRIEAAAIGDDDAVEVPPVPFPMPPAVRLRTAVSITPLAAPVDTIAVDRRRIAHVADVVDRRRDRLRAEYAAEERPTHFETGSGFAIAGGVAVRGLLGPNAVAESGRAGAWWRVGPPSTGSVAWRDGTLQRPLPLLVERDDGRWAAAATIPGAIATFSLSARGTESLIYRRIGHAAAPDAEQAVAALRAGTLNPADAAGLAERLQGDGPDPIVAVIAAYLFDSVGDIAAIRRIARAFAAADQPMPFDVALLAALPSRELPDGGVVLDLPASAADAPALSGAVAGRFPWMRQGWVLLEDEGDGALVDARLPTLREHLGPTPFVTLDAAGGARLSQWLFG